MARFQKTLGFAFEVFGRASGHCASKGITKAIGFSSAGIFEMSRHHVENPVPLPLRGFNEIETQPPVQACVPTGDT
jgi:hypothetical protein